MRPVKQLKSLEVMGGAGINLPGAEFDPEVSAWLRFAPWTHVDVTVGGMVTIPVFEHVAGGGLLEARGHIPLTDDLRLTLDIAGELTRYQLEDGLDAIWARRLTLMPLLVWTGEGRVTPYFGPKLQYLSHMDRVSSATFGSGPGFRQGGAGVFMIGGTFGLERPLGFLNAFGGAVDLGLMVDAERGDLDGVYLNVALYAGY